MSLPIVIFPSDFNEIIPFHSVFWEIAQIVLTHHKIDLLTYRVVCIESGCCSGEEGLLCWRGLVSTAACSVSRRFHSRPVCTHGAPVQQELYNQRIISVCWIASNMLSENIIFLRMSINELYKTWDLPNMIFSLDWISVLGELLNTFWHSK